MDLEHVQPVLPPGPDRRSRSRSRIAVWLPVLALVIVAATGLLGRVASAPAPDRPPAAVVAPVMTTPGPGETPAAAPSGDPDPLAFPARTFGLPVRTLDQALAMLALGKTGDEVVAIAGWLSIPWLRQCVDRSEPVQGGGWELLCQRHTFLAADATPIFSVSQGGIEPLGLPERRLEPRAMPGVELASIAERQFLGSEGPLRPRPVVLVGRFGDPRLAECASARDAGACARTFAIERIIWVDGEPQVRRAQRSPGLGHVQLSRLVRRPVLDSATERGAIVLSEMLLARSELATFDPLADRLVPDDVDGPVWYIRTLLRDGVDGTATGGVGWAVIEDATATVLAAEPDGRSASAE